MSVSAIIAPVQRVAAAVSAAIGGMGARALAIVLAGALIVGSAAPSQAACRQALALALDVSGSVDDDEYQMQIKGLAGALSAPQVRRALLAMPSMPIALAVFEWSGNDNQRLLIDWITIDNEVALERVVGQLLSVQRRAASHTTGLGTAMTYGATLLTRSPDCARWVLDVSGDGQSNVGPRPSDIRDSALLAPVTVNALAIGPGTTGSDSASQGDVAPDGTAPEGVGPLSAYFKANVIHGPGAFVQVAQGFADYQSAMERKLLREVQGISVSQLRP